MAINALLKIMILGDSNVGKSCLKYRYVDKQFKENFVSTMDFLNKEIELDDKNFTLQIWDIVGQDKIKPLRTPFYRQSDICLLVFSIDNRESFKNLEQWKQEFLDHADIKNPLTFPFVVLGNKVDLGPQKRQITTEEGLSWCKDNGDLPYFETSAKDSTNVDEAFLAAVKIWSSLGEKQQSLNDRGTICLVKHDYHSELTSYCF